MSLGSNSVFAPSNLSSRSAFASSPIVSVAPCKKACTAPLTVRATAAEEPKAGRREMLATLLAAGTVLSTTASGTAAMAIGIPDGGAGVKKLGKKADQAIKAGTQALENTPLPSGGGRIEGGLKDANQKRIANQSGITPKVKESSGRVDALENIDLGVAGNPLGDAADNVKGGLEDLTKNGPGKIKSDVKTAGDKVKGKVAGSGDFGKNASRKGADLADQVKGKVAGSGDFGKNASRKGADLADQVQDKVGSAGEKGKGVLDNIKEIVTDAIPQ
ncbi:hypothetical protein R1flu_016172 [Riccia fluitans]|uniref:Uncharacterized protein n=1 Tax=Riccia fluitans TaxID=41844 RepID=A0ABD1YL25_9MARC